MWTIHLECENRRQATVQVIAIDSIVRGAHLLPVYVVDHHAHQLISSYYNFLLEFRSFEVSPFLETSKPLKTTQIRNLKLPFIDELVPEICDRTSFLFLFTLWFACGDIAHLGRSSLASLIRLRAAAADPIYGVINSASPQSWR